MREKPVRSPIVPPIADSWSTNLAARSCNQYLLLLGYDHFYGFTLLIRSNVDAENDIWTYFSLLLNSRSVWKIISLSGTDFVTHETIFTFLHYIWESDVLRVRILREGFIQKTTTILMVFFGLFLSRFRAVLGLFTTQKICLKKNTSIRVH